MTPPDYTGKYVDLRLIGQGGFGSVWWAWDPGLKRPVAIKVMLAQLAEDEAWVARFQQEARFMAQVDGHPNIVRVIELHQDEHGLSIVMDYCPNGNLEDLIRSEGPFSPEDSVGLISQIAEGLSAAHAVGIVHRDIKPLNILLDEERICKISDFGIAASTDRPRYTRLGSAPYMAPEQKFGRRTDARADVFSLGVTLYQMLTGEVPEELYRTERPRDPRTRRPELPVRVVEIIFKAIEFDPDDRYQTVGELLSDLKSYGSAYDAGPFSESEIRRSGPPRSPPRPSATGTGSGDGDQGGVLRWLLFGGGAALISAVIIVIALAVGTSGGDGERVQVLAPADTATPEPTDTLTPEPTDTPTPEPNANSCTDANTGHPLTDTNAWARADSPSSARPRFGG